MQQNLINCWIPAIFNNICLHCPLTLLQSFWMDFHTWFNLEPYHPSVGHRCWFSLFEVERDTIMRIRQAPVVEKHIDTSLWMHTSGIYITMNIITHQNPSLRNYDAVLWFCRQKYWLVVFVNAGRRVLDGCDWQLVMLDGLHDDPRQNGRHFADDIFKCIFLNENAWISLKISLKFVPKVRINNILALVQIMAWRRPGDKPLSEPMMDNLVTHICVTRPQWVKCH